MTYDVFAQPIGDAWTSYRRIAIPIDAGPTQVDETRRAFYAGATVVYAALMMAAADGIADDAAERLLVAFRNELDTFAAQVAKGDA